MPLQSHFKTSLKYLDEVLHLFTSGWKCYNFSVRDDAGRTHSKKSTNSSLYLSKVSQFCRKHKVQCTIFDTKMNDKF
jgi:hypothetical protein